MSSNLAADTESIEVDLKNQGLAALLAWLWPGAGHLYQARYGKAVLFMVCILTTYFFGLTLGGGQIVYASWKKDDRRWQYGCQVWVGLPALPAVAQTLLVNSGREPLLGGIMAPPRDVRPGVEDELARWHKRLGARFELGTLYTVIAGLLNVLAIYDAYAGPFLASREEEDGKKKSRSGTQKQAASG